MKYSTLPPPIHLQPYIRCFWVLEHEFGIGEDSYIYRSVADGCVEMVFHYQSAFEELITSGTAHNWRSGIHFQSSHYRRFETKQSFGLFGAYIYPFAIPYFFRVPSAETSNEMLDLETFLGFAGRELEEKIMIAPDNQKRVEILTAFFEKRLQRPCQWRNIHKRARRPKLRPQCRCQRRIRQYLVDYGGLIVMRNSECRSRNAFRLSC